MSQHQNFIQQIQSCWRGRNPIREGEFRSRIREASPEQLVALIEYSLDDSEASTRVDLLQENIVRNAQSVTPKLLEKLIELQLFIDEKGAWPDHKGFENLAQRTDLSEQQVQEMIHEAGQMLEGNLGQHPHQGVQLLHQLTRAGRSLPKQLHEKLLQQIQEQDRGDNLMQVLLADPNTPPSVIQSLWNKIRARWEDQEVRPALESISLHSNTPDTLLVELVEQTISDQYFLMDLMRGREYQLPQPAWDIILQQGGRRTLRPILSNGPTHVKRKALQVGRERFPKEIMEWLKAAQQNPQIDLDWLQKQDLEPLLQSSNTKIRSWAVRQLKNISAQDPNQQSAPGQTR